MSPAFLPSPNATPRAAPAPLPGDGHWLLRLTEEFERPFEPLDAASLHSFEGIFRGASTLAGLAAQPWKLAHLQWSCFSLAVTHLLAVQGDWTAQWRRLVLEGGGPGLGPSVRAG